MVALLRTAMGVADTANSGSPVLRSMGGK